ncbi:hypothetical protein, unknown function [Leishmania tarentolae]|uniref:Uncharacterized protein n=1 Tax=Leishmania tarentolae TaxID=5689 RepID=A0A640K912_LEITA|nr:hypothetical protein, unknown function [Leishmania tarentolae]
MSNATLPHAVALAQELETELRHLEALQQHYTQLLVRQLSSLDFLGEGDAATIVAAKEPTLTHNRGHVVAKRELVTASACIKQPSAVLPPWRHHTHDEARVLQPASRNTACHRPSTLSGGSSPFPQPKRRGRSTVTPVGPQTKVDMTCNSLFPQQSSVATALVVPVSTKDEATRRARRALRCLREERDAYFNAKARRAEVLLHEGREAARKSRARRQAEVAAPLSKWA